MTTATKTAETKNALAKHTDGKTRVPCWKCGGSGYLTWTNVDGGRCWACQTRGWHEAGRALSSPRDRAEWFISTADGWVWHFYGRVTRTNGYGDTNCFAASKAEGDQIDMMYCQVFRSGANLRRDRSVFHCIMELDRAREMFRAAKKGEDPKAAAERLMADKFSTCAWSWNAEIMAF